MKSLRIILGIAITAAASAVVGQAEEVNQIVVENRELRLEIAGGPSPHVAQLVHRGSGQVLVDKPAFRSLFSLVLAGDDGTSATIDSTRAGEATASTASADDGQRVVLRYSKFPELDLAVEATIRCPADDPLTYWSIRVENRTGKSLRAVRFPQLLARPAIGDAADDDGLVLPALAGTWIENPAKNWNPGRSVTLSYPGNLSAQFLAYQDRSAGIYLAGADAEGHPMSLVALRQADGFRFWHEYVPVADGPSPAGEVWESPYPVALGVTEGTWCDSADRYKAWAVRQPWCARTLAERDDIPAWWKAGPAVHVLEVRTYDGARTCNGSYYPKLLEHLRALREKIDGPVVPMLAGWENHRRWTAGDYFPIFDETEARPVLADLARDGFRPFWFLSGLYYTSRNEGRDGDEIPAAAQYRNAYVIDVQSGNPKEYVLNESNPSGEWKRHSHQFCVSAPETRDFFRGVVDRAHALGIDVLQMDQTVSGAGDACASASHGHVPGAGLYQSRDFRALLEALRAHGKGLTPDFVLFHEEPHEQLIPCLDGFHVREYYEKRWYREAPGAVGIPLFCYLYHEYALGYGGDSAGLSRDNNRWNVRSHAVNLITGRTPGVAIWSSHAALAEAHPDQIGVLRRHSRLLKTKARDCLMVGRMLHPLELSVPKLSMSVPVQRDGKWVREELPTPAILASSWESPAGAIGHLFMNISEERQPLAVNVDTRNVSSAGAFDVEIYRSTAGEAFQPLWSAAALPQAFSAEMEPLEVLFLELRGRTDP